MNHAKKIKRLKILKKISLPRSVLNYLPQELSYVISLCPSVSNDLPLDLSNVIPKPLHRQHCNSFGAISNSYLSFHLTYLRDAPRNFKIKGMNTHHWRLCTTNSITHYTHIDIIELLYYYFDRAPSPN